MKGISLKFLLLVSMVFTLNIYAGEKRYDIKSGVVHYSIESKGNVMGFSTSGKGNASLYFKNWGNLELSKDEITQQNFGTTETEKSMTKVDGNMVYSVDFNDRVILKQDITALKNNQQLMVADEELFKKNGGKKIGSEKVLGYNCEIWEIWGQKIWLYKGVPLKMVAEVMGVKTTEIATKAEFNISVSNKHFTLPNYPMKSLSEIIAQERMQHNMNQDESMPNDDQMKQMQEQMQNFLKGFGN